MPKLREMICTVQCYANKVITVVSAHFLIYNPTFFFSSD